PVRARVTRVGLPSFSHIRPHPAPARAPTRSISGAAPSLPWPSRQDSPGIHCLGVLMRQRVRAARPAVPPGASTLFAYASHYTWIGIELEGIGNLRSRDVWNRRRGRRLGPFPPRSYLGDPASRPAAGSTDGLGGPPGPGPSGHGRLLGGTRLP